MKNQKPIFLWGYMGSGKSRLAKRLASSLGYECIDLDEQIESKFAKSVVEIFEEFGEQVFRDAEHEMLKEFSTQQKVVISCGGGSPCFKNNKTIMNSSGITIFLDVKEEILLDRLWNNKDSRPLISSFSSKDALQEFISRHFADRLPYYSQAAIIYDNTYPKSSVNYLIELIQELENC